MRSFIAVKEEDKIDVVNYIIDFLSNSVKEVLYQVNQFKIKFFCPILKMANTITISLRNEDHYQLTSYEDFKRYKKYYDGVMIYSEHNGSNEIIFTILNMMKAKYHWDFMLDFTHISKDELKVLKEKYKKYLSKPFDRIYGERLI